MTGEKKYKPEFLDIGTKEQAEKAIEGVGAQASWIMAPKAIFRVVKLHSVRSGMANIIKQEMLSIGGEAAVSKGTVNCSVPETDILLMGTLKHYKLLIDKMKSQVAESKEIAEELEGIFRGML